MPGCFTNDGFFGQITVVFYFSFRLLVAIIYKFIHRLFTSWYSRTLDVELKVGMYTLYKLHPILNICKIIPNILYPIGFHSQGWFQKFTGSDYESIRSPEHG